MPEGHTIHRLARDLNKNFRKATVQASSPQGRFSEGAARLDGVQCERFDAWGKHLFGRFDSGEVLHVHLGLIGKFRKATGDPVGAVRLRLTTEDTHWDLRGPMVCVVGGPELVDDATAKLGPDPLRDRKAVDAFVERVQRKRIPIGQALLDQSVIAGVGNVYRAEFLFLSGLDPRTPANQVDETQVRELWDLAVEHLNNGVKLNRIVTTRPADVGVSTLRAIPAGERLYTYKRRDQPCRVCDSLIEEFEIAGRKIWECPTCQ